MNDNGRRSFLKKSCLLGFGMCAFEGASGLAAGGTLQPEPPKPESIHSKWISSLVIGLKDESPETARRIIKGRSQAHFDDLNLKEMFAPFVGNLEAFHDFLKKEWSWVIEYDKEKGVVDIDENKSYCVCPLIQNKKIEGLGALCYCSEGIAESMFSYVTGKSVKADVVRSVLRGAKSCKYRVTL
jgi:predicted hydrocarbon binding protein